MKSNKRTILLIFILFLFFGSCLTANAQTSPFKNPTAIPLHVGVPKSEKKRTTLDSSSIQNLNGKWKFTAKAENDFWSNSIFKDWNEIEVPAEWSMRGYEVKPGNTAAYIRKFRVANDLKTQRVWLHFDAVYSDCTVYLNGEQLGSHIGGFLPFNFDITEIINKDKENTLALAIRSESVADTLASGNRYAKHDLGGIVGNVSLFATPNIYFSKLSVLSTLDDNYKNGELRLDFDLVNKHVESIDGILLKVEIEPIGIKAMKIAKTIPIIKTHSIKIPEINSNQTFAHKIKITVSTPEKWHAETPFLYRLKCSLTKNGKSFGVVHKKIGFRKVEAHNQQILVNGIPVKLRGICRHKVHPLHGRAIPDNVISRDVELFRAANINFIRTSHYPPTPAFLELCDEYGIFVLDEAPFCWAGQGSNIELVQDITKNFMMRDLHHPSVIIWSQANESHWSPLWEESIRKMKALDPTRLVMFSHSSLHGVVGRELLDIGQTHYPGWKAPERYSNYFRPVILDEYLHINTYNETELVTDPGIRNVWGSFTKEMWRNIVKSHAVAGGSIWGGIDEVFFMPSGKVVGYGTWGIIDGWRREKPEYWHTKKSYSPFKLLNKECLIEDNDIILDVENQYNSISFSNLLIKWKYGGQSGTIKSDLEAGNRGHISIPIEESSPDAAFLDLEIIDHQSVSIDRYRIPVGIEYAKIKKEETATGNLAFTSNSLEWLITGESFELSISKKTGLIERFLKNEKSIVLGGPHLMLLPIQNTKVEVVEVVPQLKEGYEIYAKSFASSTCTNWELEKAEVLSQTDKLLKIRVYGEYKEAKGDFTGQKHLKSFPIARFSVSLCYRETPLP